MLVTVNPTIPSNLNDTIIVNTKTEQFEIELTDANIETVAMVTVFRNWMYENGLDDYNEALVEFAKFTGINDEQVDPEWYSNVFLKGEFKFVLNEHPATELENVTIVKNGFIQDIAFDMDEIDNLMTDRFQKRAIAEIAETFHYSAKYTADNLYADFRNQTVQYAETVMKKAYDYMQGIGF